MALVYRLTNEKSVVFCRVNCFIFIKFPAPNRSSAAGWRPLIRNSALSIPEQVIRRGLESLAAQGVGACTYPSGHVDTLETVVRRAMVTGINQTAIDISLHNARQLNCRFMELSAHSGARTGDGGPDYTNHSWWQGQIVSLDGEPGYLSLKDIGYGDVKGFSGANCRHNWHLFWPGISTPAYTPEALAEYNAPKIPWKGQLLTEEQARQKQRALERQIRRAKRECIVAEEWGVPSEESAAKARLARARARLNAYLEETGLKMDEGHTEVAREQQNAAYTARKATLLDIKSTRGSGGSTG